MLVLTRKIGEKITFPGLKITITLLDPQGHQYRVGIEAPREVKVLRGEVEPRDEGGENADMA